MDLFNDVLGGILDSDDGDLSIEDAALTAAFLDELEDDSDFFDESDEEEDTEDDDFLAI